MLTPLNELAVAIHDTAVSRGWWNKPSEFGTSLALVHSEVSEALEEWRNNHPLTEVYWKHPGTDSLCLAIPPCPSSKPEGVPTELADVIIRVLDICAYHGIDIDESVRIKMEYNVTRPQRHGNKLV